LEVVADFKLVAVVDGELAEDVFDGVVVVACVEASEDPALGEVCALFVADCGAVLEVWCRLITTAVGAPTMMTVLAVSRPTFKPRGK
jgi:hypothetical protein